MKLKDGVIILGLHPMMQIANTEAAIIYNRHGQELVITDGVIWRETGLHPLGRACDWRIRYFDPVTLDEVIHELRQVLTKANGYDVVYEPKKRHIHCEYDPVDPKII